MLNIGRELEKLFEDFGASLSMEDIFKAGYRAGLRANGYEIDDNDSSSGSTKNKHWAEDIPSDCTDRGVFSRLLSECRTKVDKMDAHMKSNFISASANDFYFNYEDSTSMMYRKNTIQDLRGIALALQ